jgi:Domain of unknown function (DUF4062)
MFFIAYHVINSVVFGVGIVFAYVIVSKLRSTSATYNARLLPFAYYSLTAWMLWYFQYVSLMIGPFSLHRDFFQNTSSFLAIVQTALWVCAVLSLYSNRFYRVRVMLFCLIAFSVIIAWIGYRTTVLNSEPFILIDAVSNAVIFAAFAYSIAQFRVSKKSAVAFLIHGLTQWVWRYLWSTSLAKLAFPFWRSALLVNWILLISATLQRAQSSYQHAVRVIDPEGLPNPQDTFGVMISSTVKDLDQERDATDRAIRGLRLTRFRAETYGSRPHSPLKICASMATGCDIFILIIGERYGSIIESEGISVVEFEYNIARADDPEKILVYVKDSIPREPRLAKFLDYVQDFTRGYFTSSFTTPEELYEQIQSDVVRWLTSRAKQPKPTDSRH